MIAPPPRLSRWANNKAVFSETVARLFGPESVPRTESAWNMSMLAERIRSLADETAAIGLKLPNAGGEGGNVVLPTESLRGKSPSEIVQSLIFDDWMTQPFAVQVFHHIEGLDKVLFAELLNEFQAELFDVRTRSGSSILYNPGRPRHQSGISAILLANT